MFIHQVKSMNRKYFFGELELEIIACTFSTVGTRKGRLYSEWKKITYILVKPIDIRRFIQNLK